MSKGAIAGIIGSLLVIGLISNACSDDGSTLAGSPVTIQSVQTFTDFTLSDGRQVHDVLFDSAASMMFANPITQACVNGRLNTYALSVFTGRSIASVTPTASNYPNVRPMPGHQPVSFTFTRGSFPGDDGSIALTTAYNSAASACYAPPTVSTPTYTPAPTTTTDPAPTTTTTEPPVATDPDVNVDVDRPYVPAAPQTRVRTGHSGHPCLPGERDGDHDGYCGEGK